MLLPISLHVLGYFLCSSTWGNVPSVQAPTTELPYYSSAFKDDRAYETEESTAMGRDIEKVKNDFKRTGNRDIA